VGETAKKHEHFFAGWIVKKIKDVQRGCRDHVNVYVPHRSEDSLFSGRYKQHKQLDVQRIARRKTYCSLATVVRIITCKVRRGRPMAKFIFREEVLKMLVVFFKSNGRSFETSFTMLRITQMIEH